MTDLLRNRHPADELADVRDEIRKLEQRERTLRSALLEMPEHQREGDKWFADVRTKMHERVDLKMLQEQFGHARLTPFMRESTKEYVFLIPTKRKR